ncbi:programmed cell death protein 1-like [Eulemur rufifrons]|uniref:programmed cell death protein 1-like n=1 Tax=Eulemur rufifrons TaxID=859984 RepID=UPI003741F1F6
MRTPQAPWPVVWALLQLGWRPGRLLGAPDTPWEPPTFSPARLSVPEGANATFTCSFANTSESFVLNWYRMSPSNQTDKLAAFPKDRSQPGQDPRFRVTQQPNGRDFQMSVVAARRNDSGIYLCGAIFLTPKTQIKESPRAELTVTERAAESPTPHPSAPPKPGGQFQSLVVSVTSVLVGVLVLLLLAWVLTAACPRATRGGSEARGESLHTPGEMQTSGPRPQRCEEAGELTSPCPAAHPEPGPPVFGGAGAARSADQAPVSPCPFPGGPRCLGTLKLELPARTLPPWFPGSMTRIPKAVSWHLACLRSPSKEDPSAVPAFTVDYGELDFQCREKTPEPPAPCVPEQTEYATIVFPNGLSVSSPGRRVSADSPRGPRPLRPEDGHCSWPL